MAMILIFLIAMSCAAGAWADCSTIQIDHAKNLDVKFIYETWFEQYRYAESDMDDSRCNWADFRSERSFAPNISLTVEHYNKEQGKRITKKGKLFNQSNSEKNKFKLQWENKDGTNPIPPIDYVILKHSNPYEEKYIIVVTFENLGRNNCQEHVWIYTGHRKIDENELEKIKDEARNVGVDTDNLIRTDHENCGNKYEQPAY